MPEEVVSTGRIDLVSDPVESTRVVDDAAAADADVTRRGSRARRRSSSFCCMFFDSVRQNFQYPFHFPSVQWQRLLFVGRCMCGC